jgi:KipI family sensor histidine kinase inhibitor
VTVIRPFGDAALQVVLGDTPDAATLGRVHALARRVSERRAAGEPWGVPVPGMTTLLVPFQPAVVTSEAATERLARLTLDATADPDPGPMTTHRITVRYGGDDGPDLTAVAERLGLTPDRVVELHTSVTYRVAILGFMPGFGYLGDLPAELRLPRRGTPRTRVPAGSVAIAGHQTAVYPAATPGGWHLLGRTQVRPWDLDRDPPALLAPGDLVVFDPVG